MLRFTKKGDLLVSLSRAGRIVLLKRDTQGSSRPQSRHTLLSHLNRPHGIALHEDWLYVAETDAVGRIRFDRRARAVKGEYERIAELPSGGAHWTRTLGFGPANWLYVSVGSSCNACEETDPRRAALLRFHPEGGESEVFATGLRNTVGFQESGAIRERKFVTGFEVDEEVIGRPVDVAEGPDSAIYISDDFTGSIYRVVHKGENGSAKLLK